MMRAAALSPVRPGAFPLREGMSGREALVLVVDGDPADREAIGRQLEEQGYRVVLAPSAEQGLEALARDRPDLVVIDVLLPGLDGYEATRRIKAEAGARFVPVLFVTAVDDEVSLARCLQCGGDDFLVEPYQPVMLAAKVEALMRIRDLYETANAQRETLDQYRAQQESEFEVAERLFSNIVHPGCLNGPSFRYLHTAMSVFNGDLLLAAPPTAGGLRVLVGDFTGHGLAAAVASLPVSEVFYGMTAKGFSIGDLIGEINQKLRRALPLGRFLAAAVMELDSTHTHLTVWNGGLPDIVVLDGESGEVKIRHSSQHLPLATVDNAQLDRAIAVYECRRGDRILAYSDGVLEAENPSGEMFGSARLDRCLADAGAAKVFDRIVEELSDFRAGHSQSDDVTLLEVHCDPTLEITAARRAAPAAATVPPRRWAASLELDPTALRSTDPLPLLTPFVLGFQGLERYWEQIFTVLAELYTNALEHGVLGLDSALKRSAAGFASYYAEREERLAGLERGWLRIELEHRPGRGGGELEMRFEDSGNGFDPAALPSGMVDPLQMSGRGIPLLRELCAELSFQGRGNQVSAVYRWRQ